ncbi:platelet glycoprotein IX [Cynoglossus semilaevis]|uniref:platelet glycoprotein IX n=1 Tax=Cynoglossus semilaevis TaxID=244447 RepID=UPI000494EDED|nr:platelet glycoprotein IX-like [Cynoglossus semilaevis]
MPPGGGLAVLLLLLLLLFLLRSTAQPAAPGCLFSVLSTELRVNCSSLDLVELPVLPPETTELHLHNNRLTTVSPGRFDRLLGLKTVSLHGNIFHCDCQIQYLRNWLLKNPRAVVEEPVCTSPSSVAHTSISALTDDYFSSCGPPGCSGGAVGAVTAVVLACVLVLLLWSLRLARTSSFTLFIHGRHSGFEARSLPSLRPKHRKRLNTTVSEVTLDRSLDPESSSGAEDLQRPLLNMELLPQVLDVLHRKHDIKIKEV